MSQVIKYSSVICSPKSHQLTSPEIIDDTIGMMLDMPQADCPVKHYFGPGIYIREVSIQAGVFSIGHYQKTEHLNHMVKGRVIMMNEDGTTTERKAGDIYTAPPGRKVGLIVEDMVWHNIYHTNETDIDILEETYLDKIDLWESHKEEKSAIEFLKHHIDREDYKQMLKDTGFTHDQVLSQSQIELDNIPMPNGVTVKVSKSPIEGKGLFSLSSVKTGETIAPARLNGKRTPAGRYTNHAKDPNSIFIKDGEDIYLKAIKDIGGCRGGELGDEITVDYRQAVEINRSELCQA